MSADDYIKCPFCNKGLDEKIEQLKKEKEEAYNTLPVPRYEEKKQEIEKQLEELKEKVVFARVGGVHEYQFEEDGKFSIGIGASCKECKNSWQINASVKPTKD